MIRTDNAVTIRPSVDPGYFLREYDEVLTGRKKTYSAAMLSKNQGAQLCADMLRYIFKYYLHWTPEQVRDELTPDAVERLKLAPLIKRIPCPDELDPNTELYFVAWYLYPETRNVSDPELIIKLFNNIMAGTTKKFPSGYFDGNDGYLRAKILLHTVIREYLPPFENLEALYAYFASDEGKQCITRYKLVIPLRELYGTPLAYLHDTLSTAQKSEELYEKYKNYSDEDRASEHLLPVSDAEMDTLYMSKADDNDGLLDGYVYESDEELTLTGEDAVIEMEELDISELVFSKKEADTNDVGSYDNLSLFGNEGECEEAI